MMITVTDGEEFIVKTDKHGVVHLSETEIVDRGWTKAGVLKFLGEPDWRPNFYAYGQSLQWRLYQESRVLGVEITDEWKMWRAKSEKRREAARVRAGEVRAAKEAAQLAVRQEYEKEVQSIEIRFTRKLPELDKLRVLGEKNWVPALNSDPSFTETSAEHSDRVTVNYVRHHCTNYDEVLYEYNIDDVGYPIISEKVHALIADEFPVLRAACEQRVAYSRGRSFGY